MERRLTFGNGIIPDCFESRHIANNWAYSAQVKSGSLQYAPALDGLRGLAVAFVVGAHVFPRFTAGRVGVDVFFVLSGYLITTILLGESRARGAIDLRAFYIRRLLRLAPPLALLLLAYIVSTPIWVSAGVSLKQLLVVWGASATYTWNLLIVGLGVLPAGPLGAMSHLWSLAQEEQFYLVFPLVLVAALRRRVKAATLRRSLVVVGAAMFAAYAVTAGSLLAEFSPGTRGFGLVAGCLLALNRWGGNACRAGTGLAWGAVLGLTLVMIGSIADWLPSGADIPAAVLATLAVAAHVTAAPASLMGRMLRSRPLVWLGLVSYSLYLWHLPLLVFTGEVWGWSQLASGALAVPVALLLAELSRRYVEGPIARVKERWVRAQPVAQATVAPTPAAQD